MMCYVIIGFVQHGNTALHEAAWKGYSESCQTLVRARADLHLRNRGGFAPLHLACQNGHNQSCRVLLLAAADADIKNNVSSNIYLHLKLLLPGAKCYCYQALSVIATRR